MTVLSSNCTVGRSSYRGRMGELCTWKIAIRRIFGIGSGDRTSVLDREDWNETVTQKLQQYAPMQSYHVAVFNWAQSSLFRANNGGVIVAEMTKCYQRMGSATAAINRAFDRPSTVTMRRRLARMPGLQARAIGVLQIQLLVPLSSVSRVRPPQS